MTDHIIQEALQVALPSLLDTSTAAAILHAPHTDCLNCLSPHHFRVALCCWLRIPIMCHHQQHHSKIWLHNQCCNTHLKWFKCVVKLAGLAPSATAVCREPKSLIAQFPGVRPLDVSVNTFTGIKGIDVIMMRLPNIATKPEDQLASMLLIHISNE
eukprot:3690650-Ditylum_brightwellii.AAC.1